MKIKVSIVIPEITTEITLTELMQWEKFRGITPEYEMNHTNTYEDYFLDEGADARKHIYISVN
ncbi:MAG: hypothetical protein ACLFP1_07660 [Candidatus Goldiibacteriota bacterium]